jgi:chromosome segregation ATPase
LASRGPAPNYDVFDTRLKNNEQAINTVSGQLTGFIKDTGAALALLSDKIGLQQTTWAQSRNTNWYAFATAACALFVVAGGFLVSMKAPIDEKLMRLEAGVIRIEETAVYKDDYKDYRVETAGWIASLRDRLGVLAADSVSQRQLGEISQRLDQRDAQEQTNFSVLRTRIDKEIDTIEGALVKRPEIEAANKTAAERVDALSSRLNDLQKEIEALLAAEAVAAANIRNAPPR